MPTSFHSLKKRGEAIGKSNGLSGARVSRKHPSSAFVRRGQALGFPPHDSVSLPCVGRCSSPSGALRQQALARMLQVTSKSQCKIGQSYSSNRCRAMDPVWKAGSQQRCGAVFPQGEFWSCRPRAAEISVIIRHSSGSQCESVDVKVEVSFPLLSEGTSCTDPPFRARGFAYVPSCCGWTSLVPLDVRVQFYSVPPFK